MNGALDSAERAFAALQQRYIDALDHQAMAGWLACFDRDGEYYVIGADNDAAGLPLCLMMDDTYARLEDRVTCVTRVWPGAFEDYQTRHFLQPLRFVADHGGLHRGLTNFSVFTTGQDGHTALFVAGRYEDRIRISDAGALFQRRRVVLDTFVTPGVVVYPL